MCNGCSMLFLLAQIPQHFSVSSSKNINVLRPLCKYNCMHIYTHHPEHHTYVFITLCRNNKCELRFRKQHLFSNLDVYFSLYLGSTFMLVFHILQSFRRYFMSFWSTDTGTHTAHESYWHAVLIEFKITTAHVNLANNRNLVAKHTLLSYALQNNVDDKDQVIYF